MKGVTITDDKGHIYTTPQFVEVFAEDLYAPRQAALLVCFAAIQVS
jgi:hypothetical protein